MLALLELVRHAHDDGKGEAAIVAAQIRSVRRHYRCHRKRVSRGHSAGGALAAVMGVRYPGLVRAVAVHSGLACGAAKPVVRNRGHAERTGAGCGGSATPRAAAPSKRCGSRCSPSTA
jgi:poly(3-hydroxybutyrate) depolymerase